MTNFSGLEDRGAKDHRDLSRWGAVIFALAFSLAGCAGLTGIRLGSYMDDANLNAAVAERFAAEKSSDLAPVKAEVKGGIIYLSGTVASDEARTHAEKVGFQVPGSKGVVNNIQVEKK